MKKSYNNLFKEKQKIEEPVEEVKLENTVTKEDVYVTVISKGKLNVREEASKESKALCLVDPGTNLLVKDFCKEWVHIVTISGVEGYVMTEFVKEV